MKVAFGTDERTVLTETIVSWLEQHGHDVVVGLEDAPWPEVGRGIGEAVANGEADRGVVCCWTGTGVSIAANKVQRARAALCTDAETARGARRWNDANVLALGLRLTSPQMAAEILDAFLATDCDPEEAATIAKLGGDTGSMTVSVPPAASLADIRLTEWTSCGGCAAKWGASPLAGLVSELIGDGVDPALVVGLAPSDDAAVYKLSDDAALVSTTDFFPPLVDDPDDFGAIAAANACSDVFAMGGRVVLALNISAFPERMPLGAISAILGAAARVVAEAGGMVAGGHTIRSEEPIFGLAVQGLVHPERVWTKAGARPGDVLLLSKPLGTGILLAGGADDDKAAAIASMRRLNRGAAETLSALEVPPHAVTDVTGFGLLGHGWEVAERSGVGLELDAAALPLYPGALAAAEAGVRTGGDPRNRSYLADKVTSGAPEAIEALAYDPQTSGGLLAALPAAQASDPALGEAGFVPVGRVAEGPPHVSLA